MRYYPSVERINEIIHLLKNDKSKSKLEYLVYNYLKEYYEISVTEEGLQRIIGKILKSKKTDKEIDLILIEEINQSNIKQ